MELRLFVRVLFAFAIVSVALSDSVLKITDGNFTKIEKDQVSSIARDIDFSNNSVNVIDPKAFSSEYIVTLNLSHNKLTRLNADWFEMTPNLTNLTSLTLSHNEIATVDSDFFAEATKLLDIDLSYNQIHSINSTNGSKLEIFNLSHNQLNETGLTQLSNFTHLTHLDLSSNPLEQVNGAIFGDLKELQLLNLSDTSLTELKSDTFKNQVKLRVLDLSNNSITNLNESVFTSLTGLKEIYVDKNLTTILCSYNQSLWNSTIFAVDGQTAKYDCPSTQVSDEEASTLSVLGWSLFVSLIIFGGIFVYRKYIPNRSRPTGGRTRYNNLDGSGNGLLIDDL